MHILSWCRKNTCKKADIRQITVGELNSNAVPNGTQLLFTNIDDGQVLSNLKEQLAKIWGHEAEVPLTPSSCEGKVPDPGASGGVSTLLWSRTWTCAADEKRTLILTPGVRGWILSLQISYTEDPSLYFLRDCTWRQSLLRGNEGNMRSCACVLKSFQLHPTLCNPMDCSLPGSSVHGILQTRILEWVAISSSRGSFQPRDSNLHLLCLLHWQAGSLPLVPGGKPMKLYACMRAKSLQSWPTVCEVLWVCPNSIWPESLRDQDKDNTQLEGWPMWGCRGKIATYKQRKEA